MDWWVESLAALLAGLSAVLAAIAGAAAARYRDARLGTLVAAFLLFAFLGGLAFLHDVSPRYGGPFGVAPIPLGLALFAVVLLYLAMARGTPRAPAK